jgi:probable HAF family extracellular repeat protein
MKFMTSLLATAVLALPATMIAQDSQSHISEQHHYKVIDLGTFGGPSSYFNFTTRPLNNPGAATGAADTSNLDPFAPNCLSPDCHVWHPFQWKNGVLTDLRTLTDVNSGGPNDINANGVVTGISENGAIDPIIGFPEFVAVVWKDDQIINLGTFGGTYSYGAAINDRGQVVGFALNTTSDSFDLGDFCQNFPMPQQMRAFIWQDGAMKDLGTLGGTDSCALWVNQRGQAAGHSFTNSIPNPVTGLPTLHPFLWSGNTMLDLGTLGGTLATASGINNRGQVAGVSNLAGDLTFHPFLWSKGTLTDLGTLGGNNGQANSLNDAGAVVGRADLPGSQAHDAFLWKNGVMTDLGTQDGDRCSNALSINSKDQIVGGSSDCFTFLHAFLWKNGGPIADLNNLVPPGSAVTLSEATFINDSGEITAQGTLPNGDTHAFLLIPDGDCDDDCEGRIAASQNNAAIVRQNAATVTERAQSPLSPIERMRNQMRQRYHIPGQPIVPRD